VIIKIAAKLLLISIFAIPVKSTFAQENSVFGLMRNDRETPLIDMSFDEFYSLQKKLSQCQRSVNPEYCVAKVMASAQEKPREKQEQSLYERSREVYLLLNRIGEECSGIPRYAPKDRTLLDDIYERESRLAGMSKDEFRQYFKEYDDELSRLHDIVKDNHVTERTREIAVRQAESVVAKMRACGQGICVPVH
jgi:hypothetical protein